MQRITISYETSQFDPDGYWVPGSEYYRASCVLLVPDEFDASDYTDDELSEMADDGLNGICYEDPERNPAAAIM